MSAPIPLKKIQTLRPLNLSDNHSCDCNLSASRGGGEGWGGGLKEKKSVSQNGRAIIFGIILID